MNEESTNNEERTNMAENSKIEWTTHTFNPWIGCTKVSPGCANCYAEHTPMARRKRAKGLELWGKGEIRYRTRDWKKPLMWNRSQASERQRVFPSLCDWLDPEVPFEWLSDLLTLIEDTPNLDWLLLTKRPELWFGDLFMPPNVWAGTSIEDQQRADQRIPALLSIPARVHFLSVEPLLSRVDLKLQSAGAVDWVIVGGESGTKARPCSVEWVRDISQQCQNARVPCFVKQLGARSGLPLTHSKGGDPNEWPADLRIREFPSV